MVIDGIVIALIGGAVWLATPGRQDLDIAATSTMYVVIGAAYEVLLTTRAGQTVGKAGLGIAVVSTSGGNPRIGQSTLRYVVKSLQPLGVISRWIGTPSPVLSAGILTGWDVVLLASIASDGQGQGFHDRIARTVVVNVTRRQPFSSRLPVSRAPVELEIVEPSRLRKRRIRSRR